MRIEMSWRREDDWFGTSLGMVSSSRGISFVGTRVLNAKIGGSTLRVSLIHCKGNQIEQDNVMLMKRHTPPPRRQVSGGLHSQVLGDQEALD